MTRRRPALFRGRHFEDVIILLCVRWYLRYSVKDATSALCQPEVLRLIGRDVRRMAADEVERKTGRRFNLPSEETRRLTVAFLRWVERAKTAA